MNDNEQDFQTLDLEDILKEFAEPEAPEVPAEDTPSRDTADLEQMLAAVKAADKAPASVSDETMVIQLPISKKDPEQESDNDESSPDPALDGDTVRLDNISDVASVAVNIDTVVTEEEPEDDEDEDEDEEPDDYDDEDDEEDVIIPQAPIPFRPRSRLRELKRQLIAGPEKRYYELSEMGVGKLQLAILACVLVLAISVGAALVYSAGLVPENRMRLMVFSQVLVMLIGALMGSQQMIDGVSDLFGGKFTLNTLLAVTFAACCVDSIFCLKELRVPICAAFTLEVAMSLWAAYHRRTTEMGMMDTMRKATRLDSVVKMELYYEDRTGFLRGEGTVEDFTETYGETPRPEKVQNTYAFISLLISLAIAVLAGVFHGVSMACQILTTTLLVSVPASFFVATTRPMALLERRLHGIGTVLCGWAGVEGLCNRGVYPLTDGDLFPLGATKMNGVKFYGQRHPNETIAYATALMKANGGSLAPIFEQLLNSRNGLHYEAYDLQFYGNGGIGGMICDEPVLMGTLDFLKEMGVEIPEDVMVKQAVYVAIDGELSGLFAVTYARMKFSAKGLATLCNYRGLQPVLLAEDFMITHGFLKEKFGINSRRLLFPERAVRTKLAAKAAPADAPALALTTQDGLAPAAYALTGARALRTACRLGLAIHMIGGILGMLIMAALAIVGATQLLTPIHVLLYQLVWMIPGLLVTFWTRTI